MHRVQDTGATGRVESSDALSAGQCTDPPLVVMIHSTSSGRGPSLHLGGAWPAKSSVQAGKWIARNTCEASLRNPYKHIGGNTLAFSTRQGVSMTMHVGQACLCIMCISVDIWWSARVLTDFVHTWDLRPRLCPPYKKHRLSLLEPSQVVQGE